MNVRALLRGPVARITAVSLGSNIVDGIRVAAFAVLAAGYADSALEVALVGTVATLPEVFLSIPIGVMLDRWSKLRTLYLANLARALLLMGLAVTLYLGAGSTLLLCAFALIFGTLEELYDSASVLVVPDLTEPNEYLKSSAAIRWVQELGNGAIGPSMGGVLVGWSATTPFTLSAGMLLIVALALRSLHRSHVLVPDQAPAEEQQDESRQGNECDERAMEATTQPTVTTLEDRIRIFIKELWDGLVVAWRNPFACNIVIVFGLWNIFGWMPESILIVYVLEALEGDGSTYGLLLVITSVGALLGGLALLATPDTVSVRRVTALALGVYALTIAVPGIWPNFWVAAVAFFVQGLPLVLLNGTVAAQMQLTIDRRFLGRVYAVIGTVGSLSMTVGLFLGGVVADLTSAPFVFVLAGVGIGVAALVASLTFSSTTASIKDD
nr:MFS transporter [uncultured Actinomyces sp.]